jgi:hypothetical protein
MIWRKDHKERNQRRKGSVIAVPVLVGPSGKSRSEGWKTTGLREEIHLFERSEFMDFSKSVVFQGFCKTGLAFLVLLLR